LGVYSNLLKGLEVETLPVRQRKSPAGL
jgi:hypothetical protein